MHLKAHMNLHDNGSRSPATRSGLGSNRPQNSNFAFRRNVTQIIKKETHSGLGNRMMEADHESLPSTVMLGTTLHKQPSSSSGRLTFNDESNGTKREQNRLITQGSVQKKRFASEYLLKSNGPGNPQDELSNQFESSESKNDSKNSNQVGDGLLRGKKAPFRVTKKKTTNPLPHSEQTDSAERSELINNTK